MLKYRFGTSGKYRSIDDKDWEVGSEPIDPAEVLDKEFLSILDRAQTISSWDFNCALGDTMKEKFESLYLTVINVATRIASSIDESQYFWLAVPTCMCSIFYNLEEEPEYRPMGGKECKYLGILFNRLKVYECPILPSGMPSTSLLIGCSDVLMSDKYYGRIIITGVWW